MRAAAWETAPQRALGNCFKEVGGEVNIYVILVVNTEFMQPNIYLCKGFLLVTRN